MGNVLGGDNSGDYQVFFGLSNQSARDSFGLQVSIERFSIVRFSRLFGGVWLVRFADDVIAIEIYVELVFEVPDEGFC